MSDEYSVLFLSECSLALSLRRVLKYAVDAVNMAMILTQNQSNYITSYIYKINILKGLNFVMMYDHLV